MKKINWQLSRYYWQICSWLPFSWRQKYRFIRELSGNIQAFLQKSPNADMDAIREWFGTPQQISAAYVDETDTPQLLKSLRIRRRIVRTVLIVAVICVTLYSLYIVYGTYRVDETFGGYIAEELDIIQ